MEKLEVFISWSGPRSHAIAKHLKEWLPDVVRNAEPWLSSEDINKGAQWLTELNAKLSTTAFGILVLTPENIDKPWLLYEAGVISQALKDRRCCPILCGLKSTDVKWPLAQFQSTPVNSKQDMLKLLKQIHIACEGNETKTEQLARWFAAEWDSFDEKVKAELQKDSSISEEATTPRTSQQEMIEEVLQTVRRMSKTTTEVKPTKPFGQSVSQSVNIHRAHSFIPEHDTDMIFDSELENMFEYCAMVEPTTVSMLEAVVDKFSEEYGWSSGQRSLAFGYAAHHLRDLIE